MADDLVLTPPEPVPAVTPSKATGLVPLNDGQKSQLAVSYTHLTLPTILRV